jgi:hypothetical protein
MRQLQTQYTIAYLTYRDCMKTLSQATSRFDRPSRALLDTEAKAHRELMEARAKYLAALAEAANN